MYIYLLLYMLPYSDACMAACLLLLFLDKVDILAPATSSFCLYRILCVLFAYCQKNIDDDA
jgi:hypothetical protein